MFDGAGQIELKAKPFANVEDVKRAVAGYFRLTVKDLESASRKPRYAHPRQVAMALSYKRLRKAGFTYEAIGASFGNRHYSTVISACRKFGIAPDPAASAAAYRGKAARASVPMRPCKPPVPKPVVRSLPARTPEEITRAYWMRQAGFVRAA